MSGQKPIDLDAVVNGNRRQLARLLTAVENETIFGKQALDSLFKLTGQAHLIGVTGSPGAGKSSFVNQVTKYFRKQYPDLQIAIIAVDPSSPFTGGALLGDRVRMRDLAGDAGVFIRSMASRGALGGLARTTFAMTHVLDAAGFDVVMIETVGAGQSEVDITRLAHTTIVVESPGMGDDIQANKAGILEIADLLVVNKADHPMADNTVRALTTMLEFAHPSTMTAVDRLHHRMLAFEAVKLDEPDEKQKTDLMWEVPVFKTVSTEGVGIEQVGEKILEHARFLKAQGQWKKREAARLQEALNDLLLEAFSKRWQAGIKPAVITEVIEAMLNRRISPGQALNLLLENGG